MEFYSVPSDTSDSLLGMVGGNTRPNITFPINVYLPGESSRTLSGFVLGRQNDLETLLDPKNLGDVYSEVYKYLFALTLSSELAFFDKSSSVTSDDLHKFNQWGYVIDAQWLLALEGVFWGYYCSI